MLHCSAAALRAADAIPEATLSGLLVSPTSFDALTHSCALKTRAFAQTTMSRLLKQYSTLRYLSQPWRVRKPHEAIFAWTLARLLFTPTSSTIGVLPLQPTDATVAFEHQERVERRVQLSPDGRQIRTRSAAEYNRCVGLAEAAASYPWDIGKDAPVAVSDVGDQSPLAWPSIELRKKPHNTPDGGP
jgi:hypothetical protein